MLSARQKMALIPALLTTLMTGGVSGIMTATWQIENQARMVVIGCECYWDVTATMKVDVIDWGTLYPGQSKSVTIYIKNTGSDSFTGSFNTSNWEPPAAANFISLKWDFGDRPLLPGRIRETHFTLTVSSSIHDITAFAFWITVTATQYVGT